jgi:hypothetical protein
MVLFGIDDGSYVYSISGGKNIEPYLIITTNNINDELIQMIDTMTTKNIIFQVPLGDFSPNRNINFNFQVDLQKWIDFARNIYYLEFRGILVKNQFTAKHLEYMTSLKGLYIGSTNYHLFDNEDVSNLPMLQCLSLNGYGLVEQSKNMQQWIEKMTENELSLLCYC